jgi:CO/xanthine dehydrogenase Mo-binding subunit
MSAFTCTCRMLRSFARRVRAVADEIRITNAKTGGMKGSKLARFDMIPARALIELAEHYGKGEAKYPTAEDGTPNFRKGYAWSLSYAALMRHAASFWAGEDIDPETQSKHLIAVAWHALNLATYMDEHPELDDRV